ncbi:hypothetical protein MOF28_15710 [Bacillus haynesii]|uniref:hypothetical protein n=1 Tax=Bacillus haynesii TaxID=1925021 RepID=UPI00227F6397|nr:hypothetical protein [Bacillus haynesii]MCY9339802.1 hypothetical protein [Bacillus haynesii]
MKKKAIKFEETLKYDRSMVIEVPNDMTEDELDQILERIECEAQSVGDIPFLINKDVKVVEAPDENSDSPSDTKIEIYDVYDLSDEVTAE